MARSYASKVRWSTLLSGQGGWGFCGGLRSMYVDSFIVTLHGPNGRKFVCRWGCAMGLQMASENENSYRSYEVIMHCILSQIHCRPPLFMTSQITTNWRSWLYPTDSPTSTNRGLWSSLVCQRWHKVSCWLVYDKHGYSILGSDNRFFLWK